MVAFRGPSRHGFRCAGRRMERRAHLRHPISVNPVQREALRLAEGLPATPKNILRVAMATSPDASRWAFQQWELRRRAAAKFTLGREMLFDRDGLEMATHEAISAYHASCFPEGATIEDMTCG